MAWREEGGVPPIHYVDLLVCNYCKRGWLSGHVSYLLVVDVLQLSVLLWILQLQCNAHSVAQSAEEVCDVEDVGLFV